MSQTTEEIKSKLDLVEFVSEYLPLKKAGANFRANCPFHHEKTPSFMISRDKQIWHCFGCHEGGDIFGFLMKMEGLEFPEALKLLAEKAGVKLPSFSQEIMSGERNRLWDILKLSAKFYHKVLLNSQRAEPARQYLKKRGVSAEMLEDFNLGFIPEDWDLLTNFLLKKGYGINDLLAAGVTIKKDGGGYYDRFRGRIMYPINDVHGNTVGFTGRLLDENKPNAGGKYVNTPQTKVYDKSRVIYALDKAKSEARRQDFMVVVEGQMDVIACHQAGQINTVASSGTAFTADQLRLIKRFTKNLLMAFDMDAAGQQAADRGIELALIEGVNIKVISLPPDSGKDPDECLKKNPEVWFGAVKDARHIMDYLLSKNLAQSDMRDSGKRSKAAETMLTWINRLPDTVEQDFWIKKLANQIDIEDQILYEKLRKLKKTAAPTDKNLAEAEAIKTPQETASEKLLAILLRWPIFFPTLIDKFSPEVLAPANLRDLYEKILLFLGTQTEKDINNQKLIHSFKVWSNSTEVCQTMDLLGLWIDKEMPELSQDQAKEEASSLAKSLNKWYNMSVLREIQQQLREAEAKGDRDAVLILSKKIKETM